MRRAASWMTLQRKKSTTGASTSPARLADLGALAAATEVGRIARVAVARHGGGLGRDDVEVRVDPFGELSRTACLGPFDRPLAGLSHVTRAQLRPVDGTGLGTAAGRALGPSCDLSPERWKPRRSDTSAATRQPHVAQASSLNLAWRGWRHEANCRRRSAASKLRFGSAARRDHPREDP